MIRNILSFLLFAIASISPLAAAERKELTASGSLYASASSRLGSPATGKVEKVFVEVGDQVQQGQPLVKLDTTLLEIEASHKKALLDATVLEFKDADMNFARMQKLWEKPEGENPSISQKRFEESQLRREQAKVQVRRAQEEYNRALVNLEDATVKAPFDGTVTKRFVDAGASVTAIPDTSLIELQKTDPLYLEFAVPQLELPILSVGMPITFEVEGSATKHYSAKIDRIFPCVEMSTRAVTCRALVDNAEGQLRPGSLTKVEIRVP